MDPILNPNFLDINNEQNANRIEDEENLNIRPNIFEGTQIEQRPIENYDIDDNRDPLFEESNIELEEINTNVKPQEELEEINTNVRPQESEEININIPQEDIKEEQEDVKEEPKIEEQEDEKQDVNREILEEEQRRQEEEENEDNDIQKARININKRRQQKEKIRKEQIKQEERRRRKNEIEPPLVIPYNLEQQLNLEPQQIKNLEPGEIARTEQEVQNDEEKIKKEMEDKEKEKKKKERIERKEKKEQEKKLMKRIREISKERGYKDDDEDLLSLSLTEYREQPKTEIKKGKEEKIGEKRERPIIHKNKSKGSRLVGTKSILIKNPDNKLIKKKIPPLVRTEQNKYGPSEQSYTSYSELVKEGIINDPDYLEGLKKKESLNKKKKK